MTKDAALRQAVEAGEHEEVERLIAEGGVNINSVNARGDSLLDTAVLRYGTAQGAEKNKYTTIALAFIKAGADVNYYAPPPHDSCALHLAAYYDNDVVVKAILETEKYNFRYSSRPTHYTPLHSAVAHNATKVIPLLKEYIGIPNTAGEYPLDIAIQAGAIATVRSLLDNGANVSTCHPTLGTPLHIAMAVPQQMVNYRAVTFARDQIVPMLLDAGADVNAQHQQISEQGTLYIEAPLYSAVSHDMEIAAHKLIEHGADVNIRSLQSGDTPFGGAFKHDNVKMATLLIEAGADLTAARIRSKYLLMHH